MKRIGVATCFVGMAVLLGALLHMTGCEEGDPDRWLTISPAEIVLNDETATVTFVANVTTNDDAGFATPIEWRMTDPTLGAFIGGSGNSIIYGRYPETGVNVITAEDPYGAEGTAIVTQR